MESVKEQKTEIIDLNLIRKILEISDLQLFPLYLKEVYKDLIDRADSCKKNGISRITFYGYMKLPVLISDKLFDSIDRDCDGYINFKEFIEGMNSLYYGSFKQTAKSIFNIYDFNKDGLISKEDIKIIFSYLPLKNENKQIESLIEIDEILNSYKINTQFDFSRFLKEIEYNKSDIYLQILCYLYEHKPFSVENIEICKNLPKYKELLNDKEAGVDVDGNGNNINLNSTIINTPFNYSSPIPNKKSSLFAFSTEKISLSSPSKTTYFKPVENMLSLVQIEEFELDDEDPNEEKIILPINPTKGKNMKNPFVDINLNDIHSNEVIRMPNQREFKEEEKNIYATPSVFLKKHKDFEMESLVLLENDNKNEDDQKKIKKMTSFNIKRKENVCSKEGFIYKITENGNLRQYYLVLSNKDIFYYKSDVIKDLLGMHNLSGCYIESTDVDNDVMKVNEKSFFPFTILFSNKKRTYFTESLSQSEEWRSILKQAIGYQSFDEKYEIDYEKTLGEGKFGLVKLGIHKKTKEKVAIKIIKKKSMNQRDKELVKSEIDIMKMCRHKNIVRLLDHYENNDFIFIVMEYLAGNTFANYLESTPVDDLSEKQTAFCVYQIAKGLEYLHKFGIIHRDIKPENIMIKGTLPYESYDSLKIMDFGLSKILGPNEKVNDGFGTLTYVAPEVLTRKPYNKSVDIWSLGIIVFYTLSGVFPFDDPSNDEEVIAKKTVFEEVKFSHKSWKTRSNSCKDFIIKAMIKEVDKRITIENVLSHSWFKEIGIVK